ncbi:MAG TPA: M6 family metalloprotease domain-containing protein [Planctomycetes bacterium]|nr:M6 family metalloprotease domain-containing protein [Planctomycetota bacterium]
MRTFVYLLLLLLAPQGGALVQEPTGPAVPDPWTTQRLLPGLKTLEDLPEAFKKPWTFAPKARLDLGISFGGFGRRGVYVDQVLPRGPAERAGLLPGDLIQKIGRSPLRETADLETALASLREGKKVTLKLFRPALKKDIRIARGGGPWPGFAFKRSRGKIIVTRVDRKSEAYRGGLRVGDRIYTLNRKSPTSSGVVRRILRKAKTLRIRVRRSSEHKTLSLRPRKTKAKKRRSWAGKTFKLAVLLVEFKDRKHRPEWPQEAYERMLFSEGEYTKAPDGRRTYGSMRDYYKEVSCGQFDLEGRAFDWVQVPETWAYYDEQDMGPARGGKTRIFEDALKEVRKREGPKALDPYQGVVFIYAGARDSLRGSQLWPHRSSIRVGGRSVPYYIVEAGDREFASIGVHCHEFGHMLGLPDFYGYGHRTGVGKFCTMAIGHLGGGRSLKDRPFHLCAYCKIQLGWLRPTILRPEAKGLLCLRPIEGSRDQALILPLSPGGEEYFLLEVRSRRGFDSDFFRDGLLIWHYGEEGQSARAQIGVPIDLEEAHGKRYFDASLREEGQCLFPSTNTHDFAPNTFPSSRSLRQSAFPVTLADIRVYRPEKTDKPTASRPIPEGSVFFWLGVPSKLRPKPQEPQQPVYPHDKPVLATDPVTELPVPFHIGKDNIAAPGPNIIPRKKVKK